MADSYRWISLPIPAPGMGHPGDLLLKSALGLVTTVAGSSVPGVRYLGLMANAQTRNVPGFRRIVSLCPRLVHLHPPFPQSSMATGGVGNAPGNNQR